MLNYRPPPERSKFRTLSENSTPSEKANGAQQFALREWQNVMTSLAVAIICAATAAQTPTGNPTWSGGTVGPDASEAAKLTDALKLAHTVLGYKSRSGGPALSCPKRTKPPSGPQETEPNILRVPDGSNTKQKIAVPVTTMDDKKLELQPRPESGPAPTPTNDPKKNGPGIGTGPRPGGGGGTTPGAGGLDDPTTSWSKLLKCVKFVDINVGHGECSRPGLNGLGSKGSITLDDGLFGDGAMDAVRLASRFVHEMIHTKQKTPGAPGKGPVGSGPAESPAYTAELYFVCWIGDFIDGLVAAPNSANDDEKGVAVSLAAKAGFTGDATDISAVANYLAGNLKPSVEKLKKELEKLRADLSYVGGGGPKNGVLRFGAFAIDPARSPPAVAVSYSGSTPQEYVVSLSPMTAVAWASAWTNAFGTEYIVVGGTDGSNDRMAVLSDAGSIGVPTSVLSNAVVPGVNTDADSIADHPTGLFLLRRSTDRIERIFDSDNDGVVDSIAATPFFTHPTVSDFGWVNAAFNAGADFSLWLIKEQSATQGPWLDYYKVVTDTDDDLVGDSVAEGYGYDLGYDLSFAAPTLSPSDPEDFDVVGLLDAGAAELIATSQGVPSDTFIVVDLTAGSAVLGAGTNTPPALWARVTLASPLAANSFIEVRSATTSAATKYWIPRQGIDGHRDMLAAWDANGDSVTDLIGTSESVKRMVIGVRNTVGDVVDVQEYVLPINVGGAIDVSSSTAVRFGGAGRGTDHADGTNEFVPVSTSGVLVAQPVGDINNDAAGPDMLVLYRASGSIVAKFGLLSGGSYSWSSFTVPTAYGEIESYEVADWDGDGDLDLLIFEDGNINPAFSVPRRWLYRFESGAFSLQAMPALWVKETTFDAAGPIMAFYQMEMEGSPASPDNYLLALTASGTSPGFDYGGVHIPLNWDALLNLTLTLGNSAYTQDFVGTLDAEGRAYPVLCIPMGLATGTVLSAAYLALNPGTSAPVASSNPVNITIL